MKYYFKLRLIWTFITYFVYPHFSKLGTQFVMYCKLRCNSTQFVIYYKLRNYYKLQRNNGLCLSWWHSHNYYSIQFLLLPLIAPCLKYFFKSRQPNCLNHLLVEPSIQGKRTLSQPSIALHHSHTATHINSFAANAPIGNWDTHYCEACNVTLKFPHSKYNYV